MRFQSSAFGLAILATLAAITPAPAADCQDLSWSKDRLAKFDAAVTSAQDTPRQSTKQDQVAEIDAAIASLEQDITGRKGDAAARGTAILNEIRSGRDAYRIKLEQPGARMLSAATAEAGPLRDETPTAVWHKVNAYLDAVDADIAVRQAATQTKFVGN
jgi:hypothetical protein